jgi:SAM-dependent methyltransferase
MTFPSIKLFLNNLIGRLGYKLAKIDASAYSYRDDLYSLALDKANKHTNGKILDLGSGPTSWARKTFKNVTTFDQSGEVDVRGDILAMPFKDAKFDCVFCFETLEHVSNPPKALAEIRRILKPGGILIASTPFIHELHGEDYGDYWRFTRQGWKHMLRDYKEIEVIHFGKELLPHHYLAKGIK